jgi:hypothetical protein
LENKSKSDTIDQTLNEYKNKESLKEYQSKPKRARKEEEKRRNRRTIILPSTLYNTSLVSHYRFLGRNFSISYAK